MRYGGRPASAVPPDLWRPTDVDDLEPAAWAALKFPGSAAVSAGPGAGKTEFLAQRAAYLLQTGTCQRPRRILAISYKRDSASNLARRVAARVPDEAHRFVSITFDAFTKGLVDRFSQSLPGPWRFDDYEIEFPKDKEIRSFLTTLAWDASGPMRSELFALHEGRFLSDIVGAWSLPTDPGSPPATAAEFAAWSWWNAQYLRPPKPEVDFTMLNRLADLIVRTNPGLQRALRATYPFVFIDEFQDTTSAQITFLKTTFGHPGVVTTAVGDNKQRIMRFAGALEDAMARYRSDFNAKQFNLGWNFRSSPDLVAVQHHVATQLEPAIVQAISKANVEVGHVPLTIWTYNDERRQAQHIADWVAQDISTANRAASDFAIVARQKVADLEPLLAKELARHGIALRNDDTYYGKLRLQDVLKHDIARLVLGVLRLSAQDRGLPTIWTDTHALISRIRGDGHDAHSSRRASDHLAAFTAHLRGALKQHSVATTDPRELVNLAASIVDTDELEGFARSQHAGDEAEVVLSALAHRLGAVMAGETNWGRVFSAVSAEDAVTLMTIHRSKGLEYHTVIVLGLDDRQWWSYRKDVREAISTFFVGLSRAAHRLIFTCATSRARNGGIGELYRLLDVAGADEKHWT